MRTFSATEARVNFGNVMRLAQTGPVLIERSGNPLVVILSKQEYDQLTGKTRAWQAMLAETHRRVSRNLQGKELPDAARMVRLGREMRDGQIADTLR